MRCPKYENLIEGCVNYDSKAISSSHIETLLNIWPKSSNLQDLRKESCEENEKWGRAEEYFRNLAEPSTLQNRLKVWRYKNEFHYIEERAAEFYGNITQVYEVISNKETN
jgi:hypothetical protein